VKSVIQLAALLAITCGVAHADKLDDRLDAAMGRMGFVKGGAWVKADYTPEGFAIDKHDCIEPLKYLDLTSDLDLDYFVAKLKVCMEKKGWKWVNPK
jgi:hypothetical protein